MFVVFFFHFSQIANHSRCDCFFSLLYNECTCACLRSINNIAGKTRRIARIYLYSQAQTLTQRDKNEERREKKTQRIANSKKQQWKTPSCDVICEKK